MTRAVLFDIGDTLVHRPTVGPGRRLAAALGLPAERARVITRLVFRERFDEPTALAARLRHELGLERAIDAEVTTIWRAQEDEPVELPGATACVAAARAAGARVGVVSNIWLPYLRGFRRACPAIVPLVESWHLSFEAGTAKPDPALFRAALAALDVRPEETVMVGDSLEKDVLPALTLGMRALWLVPAAGAGAADADPDVPAGATVVRDLVAAQTFLGAALASARLRGRRD